MAERRGYPTIPAGVWWKLREQFQRTVPGTVTKSYLATVLRVEDKTAANIMGPLRTLGLINEEGKPTPRANKWRFDEDYAEVCRAMVEDVYPEELRHAVPDPSSDRDAAERWFMRNAGVGKGGARQMAAVYSLLVTADPKQKPDTQATAQRAPTVDRSSPRATPSKRARRKSSEADPEDREEIDRDKGGASDPLPSININIQVHISPDATPEQIEQIFASMARHLYKNK